MRMTSWCSWSRPILPELFKTSWFSQPKKTYLWKVKAPRYTVDERSLSPHSTSSRLQILSVILLMATAEVPLNWRLLSCRLQSKYGFSLYTTTEQPAGIWSGRSIKRGFHSEREDVQRLPRRKTPDKTHIYLSNLLNGNAHRLLLISKYES